MQPYIISITNMSAQFYKYYVYKLTIFLLGRAYQDSERVHILTEK